jgi:DNA-binding transcriptional LysR family regulator
MDLKDIDLNLLVVFNQLLMERRVSAVADKLGLTQPAVSNALARMRRLLGDELFLRTSRGMEPTPYATQLAEPIAYALSTIHNSLNQRSSFDPNTSNRRFTIGMTDIGEIYFLPVLMESLARLAPGVSVSTVRNTAINLRDEMEAGHVDLAMGLLPQLKSGFFQRRLFHQRYVCMFRKGHALDKPKVTLEDFATADHVVVNSSGTGHAAVDESIERKGVKRRIRLTVPHFVAVGHILQTTNMVATVPERYAMQCVVPFGLKYVSHPVALPEIGINLFWHAKFHKEPGNQWLRGVLFDTFSD